MDNGNDLMTCKEAAEFLTVPESWIRRKTRLHEIPVVRLGRYARYRVSSLMEWLEDQEERQADE